MNFLLLLMTNNILLIFSLCHNLLISEGFFLLLFWITLSFFSVHFIQVIVAECFTLTEFWVADPTCCHEVCQLTGPCDIIIMGGFHVVWTFRPERDWNVIYCEMLLHGVNAQSPPPPFQWNSSSHSLTIWDVLPSPKDPLPALLLPSPRWITVNKSSAQKAAIAPCVKLQMP